MAVEGWVIALVVGITAVQLLAYHYLRGRFDAAPVPDGAADAGAAVAAGVPDETPGPSGTDEGPRCSICGAVNRPGFTFCRRCVARIGG